MKLSSYDYRASSNYTEFVFSSKKDGRSVVKIVQFTKINEKVFNLAFGDFDASANDWSDTTVTNNGDSRKVLATVAATVLTFTAHHPGCMVYAEGNTPARTRLYQMGISNHLEEIEEYFEVYGLRGKKWETFKKGINYQAFLVKRR